MAAELSNPEKSIILFENFVTRQEACIMNPFTGKKGNPKARGFAHSGYYDFPVFKKITTIMNQEINGTVAWSPYAIKKFKKTIPRGDSVVLVAALDEARSKVHIAEPAEWRNKK